MIIRSASRYTKWFQNIDIKAKALKYEEKVKGTFLETWINYWKNLYIDYRDVALDVVKESKEKPIKALGIVSTGIFLYVCAKSNPDEVSFRDAILTSGSDLRTVHPTQQRKQSTEQLRYLEKCYNEQLVRRLNLGIASLIWIDDFSPVCNSYMTECTYLKFPYKEFKDRIVDVGFLNKWWMLSRHMENYDINDDE